MLRVLLVDDEENAINRLEKLLSEINGIMIVGKFTDPLSARSFIKKEPIDLAFLDIDMPSLDGLQLAEEIIQTKKDVHIVFITAYSIFAVKAFELYALDYLLKPVNKQRLIKTLNRLSPVVIKDIEPKQLYIQCFSKFEMYTLTSKKHILNLKTQKTKELCAYLIHHYDKTFDSDHLISVIWPNINSKDAKVNLYTSISLLRKTLQNEGYSNVIAKNKDGYQFILDNILCDIDEFHKKMNTIKKVNADNLKKIEQIIKIYSGHYFEKESYIWAQDRQEATRREFLHLLRETKAYYIELEDYETAISYLQKIIHFDPDNELDYQDMMHIYFLTGRRIEAIKVFHEYKQNLKREYDIEPSEGIIHLYNRIKEEIL